MFYALKKPGTFIIIRALSAFFKRAMRILREFYRRRPGKYKIDRVSGNMIHYLYG